MHVSEVYVSIQGEAEYAGEQTVFVRLNGCNLRCWYCDTPFTSWRPEGVRRDWRDVLDEVLSFDVRHVDVTGGEPLLQPDVVPLTQALREAGRFVTVETAGTVFRPVAADLMSISPKRPNSTPGDPVWAPRHERLRDVPDVLRRLLESYDCQWKFVIDQPADLDDVTRYLARHPEIAARRVWLMPQGIDPDAIRQKSTWIEAAARERGWRFSPRLHIELFGNVRGK